MQGGVRVLLQSPDFFNLAEEWADLYGLDWLTMPVLVLTFPLNYPFFFPFHFLVVVICELVMLLFYILSFSIIITINHHLNINPPHAQ